jgi:hypothetical protein
MRKNQSDRRKNVFLHSSCSRRGIRIHGGKNRASGHGVYG